MTTGPINWPTVNRLIHEHPEDLCRHFFPRGHRVGHEWVIGNLAGEPGDSLKIELEGPKAGLFIDFATNQSGTLIDAISAGRGLPKATVAELIGQALGIGVNGSNPASQYQNTAAPAGSIDWVRDYRPGQKQLEELAAWRGFSMAFCLWVAANDLIGRDGPHWVFPVHNSIGQIVAIHKRLEKNRWIYRPKLDSIGLGLVPLVVGDLSAAAHVIVEESQWDLFGELDVLGIHEGEPVAGIATRGAKNAGLIAGVNFAGELYSCGQNDDAGKNWLEDLRAATPFKWVPVPSVFHDAGDWLKNPNGRLEFLNGFARAQPFGAKIYIEFLRPSEVKAYVPPPGIVLVGNNHIVRGSVFVIGGAPGVGKSRLSVALAEAGAMLFEFLGLKVHCNFKTLIVQNENGRYRLKLEFTDLDEGRLDPFLSITPPPPFGLCFNKPEFRDQLRLKIETDQPGVILIDPWNAVSHDDTARDYLESFELVRSVIPNGDAAPALGILAHTRKVLWNERANGRALLNLLAGSYVLGSVPRTVWILQHASEAVNENRVVVTCCKNNDGDLGPRTAWFREPGGIWQPCPDFDWQAWDDIGEKPKEKLLITVEAMNSVFENGTKNLSLREAVKGLMAVTGFKKTTCYDAMDLRKTLFKYQLKYDRKTNLYSWTP
jgi:hypothetical protein